MTDKQVEAYELDEGGLGIEFDLMSRQPSVVEVSLFLSYCTNDFVNCVLDKFCEILKSSRLLLLLMLQTFSFFLVLSSGISQLRTHLLMPCVNSIHYLLITVPLILSNLFLSLLDLFLFEDGKLFEVLFQILHLQVCLVSILLIRHMCKCNILVEANYFFKNVLK